MPDTKHIQEKKKRVKGREKEWRRKLDTEEIEIGCGNINAERLGRGLGMRWWQGKKRSRMCMRTKRRQGLQLIWWRY